MAIDDVLVIDDDPMITEILETALSRFGLPVTKEQNTDVAAQYILDGTYKPRVVVTDFDNQDASGDRQGGLTLYHQLEQANKLPPYFFVMSGYPLENLPPLPPGVKYIPKPFNFQVITTEIKPLYEH